MNRLAVKGDAESVGTSASMCKAVIAVEMKLTPYRSLYQSIRLVFCVAFYGALMVATFVMPQRLRAHGGVIIDSGFTSHFEWLASINPYPVTTGEATITLLVFDLTNYDPVNDLEVTLQVTGPGTAANQAEDGIKLLIDPAIYPGDYSANIPLDEPGEWQLRFVVEGGDRSFAVTVPVTVAAAPAVAPGAETTPDLAATATVFAQNVQVARQQNSPLSAQVSPLARNTPVEAATMMDRMATASFLNAPWWFWGLIALIPILMGWLLLRSPAYPATDEDDDAADDETDNERGEADDNRTDNEEQPSTDASGKASTE